MHTQYWMCVYTGAILTSNLQTHTGPSRFPVIQVTCQRPFSSVSLAVVCVIRECATQGGLWGIVLWCGQPLPGMKGQCCGNRDGEDQGSTVTFSACPRDTLIWTVLFSVSLISSLSLSDAHWSDISGRQMPTIKCIKELLKNNWMCLQCFANLTLEFRRLILPG